MNVGLKASQAAKAMLAAADLETVEHFYAEIEDPNDGENNNAEQRQHPCVICWASVGQEYPPFTGNYNIDLNIMVEASADEPMAADFTAMFDEVWSVFSIDTLAEDLTEAAAGGFRCFGLTEGLQQSAMTIEDRHKRKTLVIPMNCCAKTIAAS